MAEEEMIRKGPWGEREDVQLVLYVNLFGDRRWDFIAKVSGLKRTGKSCRLRWVNYLHPGLKRGKITPHEEQLILELHAKWGNRWSRIARRLPGRTDNEIKNYCRTHMRKKAQEMRKHALLSTSSLLSNCSSSSMNNSPADSMPMNEEHSFYDTGGLDDIAPRANKTTQELEVVEKGYSMDEIWKNIALSEYDYKNIIRTSPVHETFDNDKYEEEGFNFCEAMGSPIWDYCPDLLWMGDVEDENELSP